MTVGTDGLAQLLLALVALLVFAHGAADLCSRLGQPRVVGEILGGVLLGPTVFAAVSPDLQRAMFPVSGPVPVVLDATYQLGLLLLMFIAGSEMRPIFGRHEARMVAGKYMPGTLIPVVDEQRLLDDRPDYALLFSWHIAEELVPKLRANGFRGSYIVPLPAPRVIGIRDG